MSDMGNQFPWQGPPPGSPGSERPTPLPIDGLVEVRLTVDRMRHQIMSALHDHGDRIKASIEHEVNRVVGAFDFSREVERAAASILADVVRRTVQDAITSAFDSEGLRRMVSEAAVAALARLAREE